MYGSRWGLRGSEDLQGELNALFKLENGFSLENRQLRQGGLEFGRQEHVGLAHANFGTLTLGRKYDFLIDCLQPETAHAGNSFRVSNSIEYPSPTICGSQFDRVYSFANTNAAGQETTGMWSVGDTSLIGEMTVAAAYEYAKRPAALFADGNFIANATGAAIGASGPFNYVGNPYDEQISALS